MLEALDQVDWAKFEHAYGPATDVPGWLRDLASDDAKARARALAAIDGAVNHQGWITPAAVPTVRFLVELLQAGVERAALAVMLADMSVGGFHGNYAVEGFDPACIPDDWRPLRQAVLAEHARLAAMLEDKDAGVRAAGAVALAFLPERADEGRAALRARLAKEKAQEPLATAVLALALLDRQASSKEDVDAFRNLTAHRSKTVALAAAIAVAQLEPGKPAALAALATAEGRPDRDRRVPWNAGQLPDLAQRVAIDAVTRSGDLDALAELVAIAGLERIVPAAMGLLLGPYPREKPVDPPAFEELSPAVQKFLVLVARTALERQAKGGPWFNPVYLEGYGICDVARLAGLHPRRTLDERFEGEPRWRIARRVREGRLPAEAWTACLRGLPQEAIDDVVRDLVTTTPIPYALTVPLRRRKAGYAASVAELMEYDALTASAARLLDDAHLGALVEWIAGQPQCGRIVPVVDVWTERLAAAPDPRFDPLLRVAILDLHSDGEAARRILARVPPGRREAVLGEAPFNLYVEAAEANVSPSVHFRCAWHTCALVPTESVARRAAESLVPQRGLWGEAEEVKAHREELVRGLVAHLAPLGAHGAAALDAVVGRLPPAAVPCIGEVLAALRR